MNTASMYMNQNHTNSYQFEKKNEIGTFVIVGSNRDLNLSFFKQKMPESKGAQIFKYTDNLVSFMNFCKSGVIFGANTTIVILPRMPRFLSEIKRQNCFGSCCTVDNTKRLFNC